MGEIKELPMCRFYTKASDPWNFQSVCLSTEPHKYPGIKCHEKRLDCKPYKPSVYFREGVDGE